MRPSSPRSSIQSAAAAADVFDHAMEEARHSGSAHRLRPLGAGCFEGHRRSRRRAQCRGSGRPTGRRLRSPSQCPSTAAVRTDANVTDIVPLGARPAARPADRAHLSTGSGATHHRRSNGLRARGATSRSPPPPLATANAVHRQRCPRRSTHLCRPTCRPASTWRRCRPARSRSRESAPPSPPSSASPSEAPPTTPTLVTNWTQFTQNFGDFVEGSYLAHAVYGYFLNGGGAAYVVRIGGDDDDAAVDRADRAGRAAGRRRQAWPGRSRRSSAVPAGDAITVEIADASEPGERRSVQADRRSAATRSRRRSTTSRCARARTTSSPGSRPSRS